MLVDAGLHTVTADVPFGLSAYGFATYDAYGYPGGMFFPDRIPPTVACLDNQVTAQVGSITCVAPVPDLRGRIQVTDNCPPSQPLSLEQDPLPGVLVGPGIYSIRISATDVSGNVGSCASTLTVIDPSPLILSCPTNMTIACRTNAGTEVNYNAPARTSCDANVPVVCLPPSGSTFPVGTTTVTCQATALNGQTRICTFTVTVTCLRIGAAVSGGSLNLTFDTEPGSRYIVEFKSALTDASWIVLRVIDATGGDVTFTDPIRPVTNRFYRVRLP